jgi:hypothetical protein
MSVPGGGNDIGAFRELSRRRRDHATKLGVGDGHHLHPDGAGLCLSRRCARMVQPLRDVVARSITIEAAFCVETLENALARHGKPEIFNTIRAASSPAQHSPELLIKNGIAISMDGKGSWRDNVFVEGCGAASSTRRCI